MNARSILALAFLTACLPVPEGRFECASAADCPTDWVCFAERCYEEPPDAGTERMDASVDGSRDTGEDAASDAGIDTNPDAPPLSPRPLDVLLVIDNSGTMSEEHILLGAALPDLLTGLALGSTVAGEEFPPVRDMHVGVVTTHMDVGPFGRELVTCGECEQELGYDGELTQEPLELNPEEGVCTMLVPDCSAFGERFLTYDGTPASLTRLGQGARCKTRVGIRGCGMEQPLEAALKALSPSSRMDFRGTSGHGDGTNAGFLRADSVLLVVFVTDEEDCSSPSDELFNQNSAMFPRDRLNVRCIENPAAVYPSSRYVDGLLEVHPADQLVVASLVGVPVDIAGSAPDVVLGHPLMVHDVVEGGSPRPAPVCGMAGAAPRFFEVARGLTLQGAGSENESICAEDYAPFFSRVLRSVRERVVR